MGWDEAGVASWLHPVLEAAAQGVTPKPGAAGCTGMDASHCQVSPGAMQSTVTRGCAALPSTGSRFPQPLSEP